MDNLESLVIMKEVLGGFRRLRKSDREYLLDKMREEHGSLGEENDTPYAAIKAQYIAGGRRNKIEAIKAVREASRGPGGALPILGLREAKDLVETW